jgi:transposase
MSESVRLDSDLGAAMARPYSVDLRVRVIGDISTGASRREAAERYGVSPSVVVLWAQRFEQTGSVAAKPSGGSTSPLEEHAGFLLGLITEQPDLTLDEVVAAMRKRGIPGSRSAVGGSSIDATSASKKTLYAAEQKRAEVAGERRRWVRRQGMFDPAQLVFIDESWTNTSMRMLYLPPYSPDLNPIELAISKVKADLRKACERTIPRLSRRIGRIVADFSAKECRNFFRHAGYVQI